ncbi:MAG TPA: hypothetical protein VI488_11310 [Candidatus Angelobacter sp.]
MTRAPDLVRKHLKMAQLAWRFHWFKRRLERDAAARNYTDAALTPDTDAASELLEMLSAHTTADAAIRQRHEADSSQSLVRSA